MSLPRKCLAKIFNAVLLDRVFRFFGDAWHDARILRYEKAANCSIKFVSQGHGLLTLAGDLKQFSIARSSHLKSNTYIECTGGVEIGEYFHVGRGLTIFSTNHNYSSKTHIPYDKVSLMERVVIKDFVWCGSNVTIVPGVTIGEGVVIAAGSTVTKNIPDCAIVGGAPAKILKFRDQEEFSRLKSQGSYF